jgi:hypothetical protein
MPSESLTVVFSASNGHTSTFNIRFKEPVVSIYRKRVQLTNVDLLSFVGGIFGNCS